MTDEDNKKAMEGYDLDYAMNHQKDDPRVFGEFKVVLKLYEPHLKEKVLEIGCNTGEFCWLLSEKYGVSPKGIDINADAIKIAKKKYPNLNFKVMDFHDLDEKFDVIYMQQVIEHIENPEKALLKLRELLKPGGKFILTCPNHWAYLTKTISWLMNKKFCYDPTHVSEFNPRELASMLKNADFKVIKTLTRPGFPFVQRISTDLQYKMPMYLFGDVIFISAEKPLK